MVLFNIIPTTGIEIVLIFMELPIVETTVEDTDRLRRVDMLGLVIYSGTISYRAFFVLYYIYIAKASLFLDFHLFNIGAGK